MIEIKWVGMWVAGALAMGCGMNRPAGNDSSQAMETEGSEPTTMPTSSPVPVGEVRIEVGPATSPGIQPDADVLVEPTTPVVIAPATTQSGDGSSTQPATEPATQPATQTSTQPATTQSVERAESPKLILAGVMNATFRGDVEGVRNRLHVEGDESRRLAEAMAEVAGASAKVREATAGKFGLEEVKKLDIDVVPPVVIASAVEQIDGDRAVVKLQGQNGGGIVFQKIDGQWKMSLPELIESQKPGRNIDQLVNDTRAPVGRFEDLAKRVNEGQFQSAEEVLAELAQTFYSTQGGGK